MDNFNLPPSVKTMLCQRARRLHHFIWHSVRNSWLAFPVSVQDELRDKGWAPPRPAFDVNGNPDLDNNSGEDFLFMHREMISHTNVALRAADDSNYQKVIGWQKVPEPGDPEFPVPSIYTLGQTGTTGFVDTERIKSVEFFNQPPENDGSGGGIAHWDNLLSNTQVLQGLPLGRLGSLLELTIHNWMHMRWSSDPGEVRPGVRPDNTDAVDSKWDTTDYDWLGDTYSSHANNYFWKLHGLIDLRIDQWATANSINELNWTGTWVGKMPPSPSNEISESFARPNTFKILQALEPEGGTDTSKFASSDHQEHSSKHIAEMELIVNLIQDCGIHYRFYDHLHLNLPVIGTDSKPSN